MPIVTNLWVRSAFTEILSGRGVESTWRAGKESDSRAMLTTTPEHSLTDLMNEIGSGSPTLAEPTHGYWILLLAGEVFHLSLSALGLRRLQMS
jgi:hypothetical protein